MIQSIQNLTSHILLPLVAFYISLTWLTLVQVQDFKLILTRKHLKSPSAQLAVTCAVSLDCIFSEYIAR